jgi:hypothetical protein
VLGVLSLGCDVVEGFSHAGSAIFPDEATYVNAPGLRIARGEFTTLNYTTQSNAITGPSINIRARGADPSDPSLTVIGFTDGTTCRIDGVGD